MVKPMAGLFGALIALLGNVGVAFAAKPEPWQIWHQPAASQIQEYINWFGLYTLYFIVPITIFVLALLAIVMVRFRKSANPVPSKTSHNSLIEVVWTVVPIIVLVFIAIPSFDLLEKQLDPEEEPAITIKTTGYQWYWGYEYQDESELSFDSIMLRDEDRPGSGKENLSEYPRLLAVDNELVVPVGETVRLLVTAADVIHSITIPAFGFKLDAIPGRMNETWFKAEREGLYYGQCSELCGRDHAFMPIAIRVVDNDRYQAWKAAAVDDVEAANRALMAALDEAKSVEVAGNQTGQ